jgi:hypothetical protein
MSCCLGVCSCACIAAVWKIVMRGVPGELVNEKMSFRWYIKVYHSNLLFRHLRRRPNHRTLLKLPA